MPENMATVPALVGLDLADANALAFASRVMLVSADPRADLPPTGIVISQEPLAGMQVMPASPVVVTVGGGGNRKTEPAPVAAIPV
jgi:beta-lactam-binding protein with PASTA domain